jgi:hypothetical protein
MISEASKKEKVANAFLAATMALSAAQSPEAFVKTGKIVSDFLTEEECIYLEENIKECKIYKLQPHWSYTSVIIKK